MLNGIIVDIQTVASEKLRKAFLALRYRVYDSLPYFRDNLSHAEKNFLYQKDSFAQSCFIEPLLAWDGERIVARAMLIHDKRLDALQLAFFEALPEQREAVDAILARAFARARAIGLPRVIIGLNGHVIYGVGILQDSFASPNSFDGVYSAPWYPDYFSRRGLTEYCLTTYYADNSSFSRPERLFGKACAKFSYRCINLKNLRREMDILGELFNKTLAGTPFYAQRSIVESYEMIRAFRPLLRDENILYAMREGREIGFLLWHPNFNELFATNRRLSSLAFLLKCRLRRRRIREYKINTLGVLPEFQNSGASFGLINEVYKRTTETQRLLGGETAFVWNSNRKSSLFCQAMCKRECKHYVVYEAGVR
jgi:hypothetical protein